MPTPAHMEGAMITSSGTIGLRELLTVYVDSRRPQVHPVMTDHLEKTLSSFEAALRVRVPRDFVDVPDKARPLFMLFQGTVDSLLALRSPLCGFLEASLIFKRLEEAGARGQILVDELQVIGERVDALRLAQLDVLEQLLQIFLGGAHPSVSLDEVRATGLYPGETPKDFDIFDHI